MVERGKILLSEPFLGDTNFERSAILICENNEKGSFGFVLNKPSILTLDSVMSGISNFQDSLFVGGPVAQDTLHFIHRNNLSLEGDIEIADNVYWGGNFEQLREMINRKEVSAEDFRFFLGYSGWGEGQLEIELEQESWIVSSATAEEIFDTEPEELWRTILKSMGGKYKMFSNYPIDPRLN